MDARNIEDIYMQTPLQQGMLFHTLYEPETAVYFQQGLTKLHNIDLPLYKKAWQQVVKRHTALRTAFHWEDIDEPLQVVYRKVELPIEELDWTHLSPAEQEQKLAELAEADRGQSFDLTQAPVMRLILIRLNETDIYQVSSCHHMVMDGLSDIVVNREVMVIHEALKNKQPFQLPRPRPYRDYIQWIAQQDPEEAQAYWHRQLASFSAPTTLDIDLMLHHATPIHKQQHISFSLDEAQQIFAFLQQTHLTASTLLQSAWGKILSLYSGEQTVLFGQTSHGRPVELSGFANMVGLFLATSPVVVSVNPEQTALAWLLANQEQMNQARRFQHISLTDIHSWSQIPRDRPLFETLMLVQAVSGGLDEGLNEVINRFEETNFPITLYVHTNEQDKLAVYLHYDATRFTDDSIEQLLRHLKHVILTLCQNPNQKLAQLPNLPFADEQTLLTDWNRTEQPFDLSLTVPQMLAYQAKKRPSAPALVTATYTLTYEELEQRSNQLAHYLQTQGVSHGTRVALCLPRTADLLLSTLAVQKLGATYIPVDPNYPLERVWYMVEDGQTAVLLTNAPHNPQLAVHTVCLDEAHTHIQQYPTTPINLAQPDDIAYIIYTSGSTGNPKGVQIQHQALSNFLQAMQAKLQLKTNDKLLAVTTISFDIAGLELYLPLLAGATIHLANEETSRDGILLAQQLAQVTHMQATPATWRLLLASGWRGHEQLTILSGGEALSHELAEQLLPCGKTVWNVYGPTETTIWSTIQQVQATQLESQTVSETITIGRPIANTQLFILNDQQQPVPVGVRGELYIGGAGLSVGYLNRPDLTAERFIQNPFDSNQTIYRTGDLAMYLPNGDIAFYGRLDHQVKVRGYRIELGEIEYQLVSQSTIQQAVVVAQPDGTGDNRLIAYLLPEEGQQVDLPETRTVLEQQLPAYMIPSLMELVEAFPLTPNGKVDRKALMNRQIQTTASQAEYVAPRNPTESTLADVWQALLGLSQVGIHDNFFELGGHSLMATRLMAKVRSEWGVTLPIRLFFEHPTIAEFSQILADPNESLPVADIKPIAREGNLPLSFSQQRLWFLEQLGVGGESGIIIPLAVHLEGTLNKEALQQSLNEVVHRHESLRTQFMAEKGEPFQQIVPSVMLELPLADLSGQSDEQVQARIQMEMKRPFTLTQAPLIRALLIKQSENHHILSITMHHIISDGWSVGVLASELATLYTAYVQGQPSPLPEIEIQYADYAHWQRNYLQGETLQTYLDYWQPHWLTPPEPLALPTKTTNAQTITFQNGTERIHIPAELTAQLRQLAQEEGASLYMVLLTALNSLLYRYTQQTDISVGTYIANRTYQEIDPLIGFFLNILVFRNQVSGQQSFRHLLQQVREVTLGAYAHQDIPFEKLLTEFQPDRNINNAMPFQVLLMLQNMPMPTVQMPDLTMRALDLTGMNAFANYDLTFVLTETERGLDGYIEYNALKFEPAIMAQLRQNWEQLLAYAVQTPEQTVAQLPMLAPEQAHWLVDTVNKTEKQFDKRPFPHLFTQDDQQIALVHQDRTLTYAQLQTQSNQLAHRLRALGVSTESRVGIALPRTPEMVIALLAVWKAGGAYVPLDPNYPTQRLAHMVEDANPIVMLTLEAVAPFLPETNVPLLMVNDPTLLQEPTTPLETQIDPQQLAYIIYTSGSTGTPKGVLVTHENITNHTQSAVAHYHITPQDRVLQFASINFDAAGEEIYPCLLAGGTLVLRTDEMLRSPQAFLEACQQQQITFLDLPTAYWHTLVSAMQTDGLTMPSSLRLLILGGERVWPEQVQAWQQVAPAKVRLINSYGPTEATVVATLTELTAGSEDAPIGQPIANVQAYVLSTDLQPVPMGAVGELYLGGAGIARGYGKRPSRTASHFIPHPYATGGRLYRTGDLVRYNQEGQLVFVGRADTQVKLRGFRIELDEIANQLQLYEGVETAVVLLREDDPDDKRLVAYVQAPATLSLSELRTHLRQTLPDYMIPAHTIVLDTLPLTPAGKIDRQALPAPDLTARPELARDYEAPESMVEEMIADLFMEVTGVQQVGIYDNFFDLGGHSLLATQVVARLNETFEIDMPLRTFFESPTVAQLAVVIEAEMLKMLDDLSDEEIEDMLD